MQSLPESRQQSFEELYGPPENFLEIEVQRSHSPKTLQTRPATQLKTQLTLVAHRSAAP